MGRLFKADIFSVSRPVFSAVPPLVDLLVRNAARALYGLSAIDCVEQFGGNEINSNNFKIQTPDGAVLLKRLPAKADVDAIGRQLRLLSLLAGQGVAVPPLRATSSGEGMAVLDGTLWCLFDFVEGDFFRGGDDELVSTAVEIGRLQRALNGLSGSAALPRKWDYLTDADADVFTRTRERKESWPDLFGRDGAALLAEKWESVARAWDELSGRQEEIRSAPAAGCHCDLHPHNLLVQDGKLAAFIDFESFTLMPVAASLGYAVYKLVRQHAVSQGLSEASPGPVEEAARHFTDGLRAGLGAVPAEFDTLRIFSLAELFRRLLIVFRLNVVDGNKAWNHVLPMHLAGLEEINVMFGRYARI